MRALVIDAYDSFIYILHQYLRELHVDSQVVRNNQVSLAQITDHGADFLLLGPGPGHPADAHYLAMIDHFAGRIPILGVCLGHQAIGLHFGGKITQADNLMHGKSSPIDHDEAGCFHKCAHPLQATRYHSLVVEETSIPACLQVTARATDDGYVMGLRHKTLPIESVQFHPESICTDAGHRLLANFITTHVDSTFEEACPL